MSFRGFLTTSKLSMSEIPIPLVRINLARNAQRESTLSIWPIISTRASKPSEESSLL